MCILTTPEGANLPAAASLENFPLLVRLLQTLVGPVIQAGDVFALSTERKNLDEGATAKFDLQAGGAEKIYWTLKADGAENLLEVDKFTFSLDAGRVSGSKHVTLECKVTLTVTAKISNGDEPVSQSVTIAVTEPKKDAWIARTPAKDEKPEEGQFYARDDKNEGSH